MNIDVKRFGGQPVSLEDFAERHSLTMEVSERSRRWSNDGARYCARFSGVEIGGDGMLRSASGDGSTPEAAIADYAHQIAGCHLVRGAYTPERQEFDAPNEWLPASIESR